MGALLGLAGAVLIGHIAIGTAIGSLTVPAWIELGGGVVQIVQLDVKLLKALSARSARAPRGGERSPNVARRVGTPSPTRLCFQHPRAGAIWVCVPQ